MTSSRRGRAVVFAAHVAFAWTALLVYDLLMLAGFRAVHAITTRVPVVRVVPGASPERMTAIVDEAIVWYPGDTRCLKRSVVTTWLMRMRGIPAHVRIGIRPTPVDSHAWVEVRGEIVNDDPSYQKHFIVLDTL